MGPESVKSVPKSVAVIVTLVVVATTGCIIHQPETEPSPVADRSSPPRSSQPRLTDEDREYFEDHPLMVPVDGVQPKNLRDTFNEARDGGRTHLATDILAPRGTPVIAAISGRILRVSQSSLGGITLYLVDTGGRYVYYYAHLDHYSDQVTQGLEVEAGDVIGYVGTSGNAPPNTPHLHFQVMRLKEGQRDWWNGTAVDVRPFMIRTGKARE